MGVRINKEVLNTKKRIKVVDDIMRTAYSFEKKENIEMHYSGLPLIRTNLATKIANEMR